LDPEINTHPNTMPYTTLTSGLRAMPQVLPLQVCQ
jgi:hypothetical protein